MAKKRDYEKDARRRRGIRESIEDREKPVNKKTTEALRVATAPSKKERKTDLDRLKEIKERQKAEEKAKKEKAKKSKTARKTTKDDDDFVDRLFGKGTSKKLRENYDKKAGKTSAASAMASGLRQGTKYHLKKNLRRLSSGGYVKNYVNPVTIVDNRKKK